MPMLHPGELSSPPLASWLFRSTRVQEYPLSLIGVQISRGLDEAVEPLGDVREDQEVLISLSFVGRRT